MTDLANLERFTPCPASFGRPDLEIAITVSPVPLVATFSGIDVMIANAYSKSLLRNGRTGMGYGTRRLRRNGWPRRELSLGNEPNSVESLKAAIETAAGDALLPVALTDLGFSVT